MADVVQQGDSENQRAENSSRQINAVGGGVRRGIVIAIDGPVGSGKSTVACMTAQQLSCRHVDSGAVYRAVAWLADHEKPQLRQADTIAPEDSEAIAAIAANAKIEFAAAASGAASSSQDSSRVLVNEQDVSDEIRSLAIAQLTSKISAAPGVRDAVNVKLREMAVGGSVVMDGRDIGTVVLPDADLKIFLTAEVKTRARRRQKELEAAGKKIALEELMREIEERDNRDSSRTVAPLRAANDAVVIDTDKLGVDAVVACIVELSEKILTR